MWELVCGDFGGMWTSAFKAPAGCGGEVVGNSTYIGQQLPADNIYFYEYVSPYSNEHQVYRMIGWAKTDYYWWVPEHELKFQRMTKGYAHISPENRPVPEVIPYVPPMSPEPRPDPIPWTELPGRPAPGLGTITAPAVDPAPNLGGGLQPGLPGLPPVVPGVEPGTKPPPTDPNFPGNPPHRFKPPGPREKEKKLRVPAAVMAGLKAAHQVTEWKDSIDAIWEGVPDEVKAKYKGRGRTREGSRAPPGTPYFTPDQKAWIIYRHVNDIDWQVALIELAKNGVEDWLMGKLNAGSDGFSNRHLNGNRFVPLP